MKRIFKLLFGRFTIGTVLIIAQVLFIILIAERAYNVYKWMSVLVLVLEILLILDLANRDMPADLKLPWLMVVTLVPVAGIIIYSLFSRNLARKKQIKFSKTIHSNSQAILNNERDEKIDLGYYKDCSKYIENTCGCIPFNNTKSTYYDCGESFFNDYLTDLSKAESFIFMEYFIIERGVMFDSVLEILKEKVKNGVEVRLIYDDIGTIGKVPARFYKELRSLGINCIKFNPFLPFVSAIHNNRDHRKITVIDGKVGYIGGINFADEYINVINLFGYWKDSTIRVEGVATKQLTVMFLQNFDVQTRKEDDYQKYLNVEVPIFENEGIVLPLCDGPSPIYSDLIGENTYLNLINHAKEDIKISTPYLILDSQMQNAIIAAVKRGIRVQIFAPHVPDKKTIFALTRSNYLSLLKQGVEIYEYQPGFIHTKNILIDNEVAIVGTINLDYRSLVHHYECGIMLYRTPSIIDIKNDFDNITRQSIYVNPKTFKLKPLEKFVARILKIFSPIM